MRRLGDIPHINLQLPISQGDGYEIYDSFRSFSNFRTVRSSTSLRKSLLDSSQQRDTLPPNNRSRSRLRKIDLDDHQSRLNDQLASIHLLKLKSSHLSTTSENTHKSSQVDAISNSLINAGYSKSSLKKIVQNSQQRSVQKKQVVDVRKDSPISKTTRSSSGDRLLEHSESIFGEIEEIKKPSINTATWASHRQHLDILQKKMLHSRARNRDNKHNNNRENHKNGDREMMSASKELLPNDVLYHRIEQLTRLYFPSIQILRHTQSPETNLNRVKLYQQMVRKLPKLYAEL
ncbi:unnamed protein product [Didymodactylos carnosus]|uniref:Uncharacterized protein n=1 Tax=Didymodactylos carnosus TaxID=1234261 RepID=A0A815SCJ4_9BILA|nr:unnamed protein product [Didymodactylos carnosus]CAF4353342.1 unnamed protein product [Didymodactylos carnosus]